MDKKKKYFLIKFIALCINILYYFFELKKKFNVTSKLMNIEINFKYDNNNNYELIKSLYNKIDINLLINYVNNCKFLKRINNNNIVKKEHPFLSICISTYNSEKYIEKAIMSVINQSFQNFEIIVVNDNSIDNTYKILKKLQKEDERIKVINHSKNHGTYHSRVEGVLNSKSNYILFLDPDDMILNQLLFEKVYDCYLNYNLDIIEYTVFYLKEEENKIYYPQNQKLNHYHNYSRKIIYQPELSNIIYYKPNSKKYSSIICRTVWNKIYKRSLVLKSIKYIGDSYYKNYYIIVIEDTLLNTIIFNFADNYTNLNIPGYLYNIRESSITRLKPTSDYIRKKTISFFLFYNLLYRYIKEFDKDRNYLYYDLRAFGAMILKLKKYDKTKYYLNMAKNMINDIINDNKTSKEFKKYIKLSYKSLL